jgi:hypothetical protein
MNKAFLQFYQAFNASASPLKVSSTAPSNYAVTYWVPSVGDPNLLKGNFTFDMALLEPANQTFFDTNQSSPEQIDHYFDNFSGLWRFFMDRGQFDQAAYVWEVALKAVQDWEQNHQPARLHKGWAYYCWGVTNILKKDLDRGFLLMHKALEEDRQTHRVPVPSTPSAFVTLDVSLALNVFQPKLIEIHNYLDELLDRYRKERGKTLTIEQFRTKFLKSPNLQNEVFILVYVLFRFYTLLKETPPQVTQNHFAGQLNVNLLFDLCCIIEIVIKHQKETQIRQTKPNKKVFTFVDYAEALANEVRLNLTGKELGTAMGQFNNQFSTTVTTILDNTFPLSGGILPSELQRDLLLTYGFRNHGGHNVHSFDVVYQRLPEIFQQIMNILFLTCEELL